MKNKLPSLPFIRSQHYLPEPGRKVTRVAAARLSTRTTRDWPATSSFYITWLNHSLQFTAVADVLLLIYDNTLYRATPELCTSNMRGEVFCYWGWWKTMDVVLFTFRHWQRRAASQESRSRSYGISIQRSQMKRNHRLRSLRLGGSRHLLNRTN